MDTDNCEARGGSNIPLFFYRGKTAFRGMFWVPPTPPSMENKEHWTQPGCRNPLDFRRLGIIQDAYTRCATVQVVSRSSDIGPGVKSGVKSGVSIHLVWELWSYKIHEGHLLRFFIVIKHTIEICYMCMINIYCSMEFQTVSTSCTRNLYKMY